MVAHKKTRNCDRPSGGLEAARFCADRMCPGEAAVGPEAGGGDIPSQAGEGSRTGNAELHCYRTLETDEVRVNEATSGCVVAVVVVAAAAVEMVVVVAQVDESAKPKLAVGPLGPYRKGAREGRGFG